MVLFWIFGFSGLQAPDKTYLLGRFNPQTDPRFVKPADEHTAGAARSQYLRKEAYEAFTRMAAAAKQDGIKLVIISATRNFGTRIPACSSNPIETYS